MNQCHSKHYQEAVFAQGAQKAVTFTLILPVPSSVHTFLDGCFGLMDRELTFEGNWAMEIRQIMRTEVWSQAGPLSLDLIDH